jgi:23S rRNA (guanosine2251-2'-O)-methyltransferase
MKAVEPTSRARLLWLHAEQHQHKRNRSSGQGRRRSRAKKPSESRRPSIIIPRASAKAASDRFAPPPGGREEANRAPGARRAPVSSGQKQTDEFEVVTGRNSRARGALRAKIPVTALHRGPHRIRRPCPGSHMRSRRAPRPADPRGHAPELRPVAGFDSSAPGTRTPGCRPTRYAHPTDLLRQDRGQRTGPAAGRALDGIDRSAPGLQGRHPRSVATLPAVTGVIVPQRADRSASRRRCGRPRPARPPARPSRWPRITCPDSEGVPGRSVFVLDTRRRRRHPLPTVLGEGTAGGRLVGSERRRLSRLVTETCDAISIPIRLLDRSRGTSADIAASVHPLRDFEAAQKWRLRSVSCGGVWPILVAGLRHPPRGCGKRHAPRRSNPATTARCRCPRPPGLATGGMLQTFDQSSSACCPLRREIVPTKSPAR